MFSTFDTAAGVQPGRSKTSADRACDQCKSRKVRCDMANPCITCANRNSKCTYDEARKKRGPVGRRLSRIRRLQATTTRPEDDDLDLRRTVSSPSSASSSVQQHRSFNLHRISTSTSNELVSPGAKSRVSHHVWPTNPSLSSGAALRSIGERQPNAHGSTSSTMNGESRSVLPYTTGQTSGLHAILNSPEELEVSNRSSAHGLGTSTRFSTGARETDFLFPSLPIDSPPDEYNLFAAIPEQDLPPIAQSVEFWPRSISQETLLPWIDVYFKRLHPTVPVLNRTMVYQEMLLRRHHSDAQFGAMLLALCAFAMTQPVQIHEVASTPSRSAQARRLLTESVKMRAAVDFGEDPSVHMVLTSFFIFACLFGSGQHKAARHRLREAVDLANALGMDQPQSYDILESERREQWLRTYLVLSVTERFVEHSTFSVSNQTAADQQSRAYALQKRHSIDFRGSPAVNAFFMRAFDSSTGSPGFAQDQSDAIGMTGLLYLMDTFDAIDESVVECWNGFCKFSDGCCESFDRRRAVQMFRAQRRVREACLAGSISSAPDASPTPLDRLLESQQADISVTQFWLLNRLWNLCFGHGLLREMSDRPELRYDFACDIARSLTASCNKLSLPAMEVHGVGLIEKVYDIAIGVLTAMHASHAVALDSAVPLAEYPTATQETSLGELTVRDLLQGFESLIRNFRGGDHEYVARFSAALSEIEGYYTTVG